VIDISRFNSNYLKSKAPEIFAIARKADSVDELRVNLAQLAHDMMFEAFDDYDTFSVGSIMRVRDCAKVLVRMMTRRSEDKAGYSVAQAIMDIAQKKPRPDLSPAFYAEMLYLFLGLQGRGPGKNLADLHLTPSQYQDQEAAIERSSQLDKLIDEIKIRVGKNISGLDEESIQRRTRRREKILTELGASDKNWNDWRWQIEHILRDAEEITQLLSA